MTNNDSGAALRRSARVNVRILVTLSGTLPDGRPFSEDTSIITVSKFGAKLKTQQPLRVGMEVKVQPHLRRQSGLFRVVWIGRSGSPRQGEVGIEYVKVSNLLGLAFPD